MHQWVYDRDRLSTGLDNYQVNNYINLVRIILWSVDIFYIDMHLDWFTIVSPSDAKVSPFETSLIHVCSFKLIS